MYTYKFTSRTKVLASKSLLNSKDDFFYYILATLPVDNNLLIVI